MPQLTCYHKNCGHTWNYKGNADEWVCCPKCRKTLSVRKLQEMKKK